jgi:hypothetical protein
MEKFFNYINYLSWKSGIKHWWLHSLVAGIIQVSLTWIDPELGAGVAAGFYLGREVRDAEKEIFAWKDLLYPLATTAILYVTLKFLL